MNDRVSEPLVLDGKDPRNLRGDPITADRYFSRDFMEKEWNHMWTRVWHIAAREKQLLEPGDFVVHDFMRESVIIVRQHDGSLKGFYNTCAHRGQRLIDGDGGMNSFTCPYHGWRWGIDGVLQDCPDRDDFHLGDPVGKVKLSEVRVGTWGSFVWYTMDPEAPELLDYLAPLPTYYKNFMLERSVRSLWVRVELNTNWKFFADNFNESYHTRTVHPQVPAVIDQDHFTSRYEMYPMGHAGIIQMGRPSLRDRVPEGQPHPFDAQLAVWDIDAAKYPDYAAKAVQGWLDLKAAKRRLWKEKGYLHYENLTDEELTESPFHFIFPNIAIGPSADNYLVLRWEPHPTDPEKCLFDLWSMVYPVDGLDVQVPRTGIHAFKVEEAPFEFRDYDGGRGVPELSDQVVFQDWGLTNGLQRGIRSRGYQDPYLSAQETRVRRFHEVLNDYLQGRPPGR